MGAKIGITDFEPHHISTVGSSTRRNHHLNVYWTTASSMDDHGYMTTGLGCVYDREYMDEADIVIVEINENLPRLVGGRDYPHPRGGLRGREYSPTAGDPWDRA